ncbi:MAG TPA: alpha/beta fold hydrolase [Candidatus Tectomicrobia bacterium]
MTMPSRCIAVARDAMQPYTADLLQAFRPFPGLTHPHLQTLVAAKLTWSRELPSSTHLVELSDGDRIALEVSTPRSWQPHDATAVLVHGLCGCHHSPYMQRLARKLWRGGIRAIRMNLRGCGSGRGLARYPYHSGRSADVLAVIESLQRTAPQSPLTLIGFSLGGNIVLKLAGELSAAVPETLQQVIAICPPVDLVACIQLLEQPANRLYNRYFTRLLCADVMDRHRRFPDLPPAQLPTEPSLYAFDECYTAPQCGFRDALDYYRQCSAASLVPRLTMPCHILFAADDPLIDAHVFDAVALPPNVQVIRTRYGGHLGFLGRPGGAGGYRAMDAQILAWITTPAVPHDVQDSHSS